jgi:hypothetical protein
MNDILQKPGAIEVEEGHLHTRKDVTDRIDAMAMAPGTNHESFAHLDEKKILRKVG